MTDQPNEPASQETIVVETVTNPTRIQMFAIKHPRAARVLAIIGVTGTALGASLLTTNVRKNRHRVENAKDHVLEAGHELSEAVSPTSSETTV